MTTFAAAGNNAIHPKRIIEIVIIILLPLDIQLFASGKNKVCPIKEVIIDHQDKDMYVTDETIRRAILKGPRAPQSIGLLKLRGIENLLDSNDMIEKSEVFYTLGGVLNAKVKQRQPIARVYDNGTVYCMDTQGKKMPLSSSCPVRVPLPRDECNEHWENAYRLMMFIQNNMWLNESITEIMVKNNGECQFLIYVPHFTVLFGHLEDGQMKKADLKVFYKQLERMNLLNGHNIVSLKYTNQVVCER